MNMKKRKSQVYFIGAGPGDPDLITVKGRKCIQNADLVLPPLRSGAGGFPCCEGQENYRADANRFQKGHPV